LPAHRNNNEEEKKEEKEMTKPCNHFIGWGYSKDDNASLYMIQVRGSTSDIKREIKFRWCPLCGTDIQELIYPYDYEHAIFVKKL